MERCLYGCGVGVTELDATVCLALLEAEFLLETLADTVDFAGAFSIVEQACLADVNSLGAEDTSAAEEVFLGDGLMRSRVMDDGRAVQDVRGGDGGVDAVVLVGVLLDDRLDHVVDVVVNGLVDLLSLVHNDMVNTGVLNLVLVATSDGSEELSVLVRVGVLLTHFGGGYDTGVVLLGLVLSVNDRLDVVLDVVLVAVQVALTLDFLNLVALTGLVGDMLQVLHILVDVLILGRVNRGQRVTLSVTVGALSSGNILGAVSA